MPSRVTGRLLMPAALAVSATLLTATTALAADAGDPRATAHDGNATTCGGGNNPAGLPGTTIESLGKADETNTYVTIADADIPAGDTLVAVVVKGGPNYNVYQGLTAWTKLHAPLNGGGNVPTISHWFA